MRTPDVKLLLYAVNRDSPRHGTATEWLTESFARPQGPGFGWMALAYRRRPVWAVVRQRSDLVARRLTHCNGRTAVLRFTCGGRGTCSRAGV